MSEVLKLLERQARWQKSRKDLSWAEKIRMAERVRADAARWSSTGRKASPPSRKPASDRK
jgi:hypothetical protein